MEVDSKPRGAPALPQEYTGIVGRFNPKYLCQQRQAGCGQIDETLLLENFNITLLCNVLSVSNLVTQHITNLQRKLGQNFLPLDTSLQLILFSFYRDSG